MIPRHGGQRQIEHRHRLQAGTILFAVDREEALVHRAKQGVLVGEAAVEDADRDPGGFGDGRDGRRFEAAVLEQRLGRRQKAVHG